MIYTEQHRELMRSVTKFVETEINPHAEEWEKAGIFPAHDVFKKMGEQGFLGINKPENFGGLALIIPTKLLFARRLVRTNVRASRWASVSTPTWRRRR